MNPIKNILRKKYYNHNHASLIISGVIIGLGMSYFITVYNDNYGIILFNILLSAIIMACGFVFFTVMREKIFSLIIKNKK